MSKAEKIAEILGVGVETAAEIVRESQMTVTLHYYPARGNRDLASSTQTGTITVPSDTPIDEIVQRVRTLRHAGELTWDAQGSASRGQTYRFDEGKRIHVLIETEKFIPYLLLDID